MNEYRIKELCKQRRRSMTWLAKEIGYSRLSSFNQAISRGLSSNRLIDVANALQCSVGDLFASDRTTITCPHCGKTITIKTEADDGNKGNNIKD